MFYKDHLYSLLQDQLDKLSEKYRSIESIQYVNEKKHKKILDLLEDTRKVLLQLIHLSTIQYERTKLREKIYLCILIAIALLHLPEISYFSYVIFKNFFN